jgi:hypothetical protein
MLGGATTNESGLESKINLHAPALRSCETGFRAGILSVLPSTAFEQAEYITELIVIIDIV